MGLLPLGSREAKGKQVDDEPTHRPVTQTSESSQTEQPLVLNTYRTPPTRPPVVRLGNEPLKVIYSNWVVDGVETTVEPGPEVEWARSSVRGEFKLVIGTEVPTVRLTLRSAWCRRIVQALSRARARRRGVESRERLSE